MCSVSKYKLPAGWNLHGATIVPYVGRHVKRQHGNEIFSKKEKEGVDKNIGNLLYFLLFAAQSKYGGIAQLARAYGSYP